MMDRSTGDHRMDTPEIIEGLMTNPADKMRLSAFIAKLEESPDPTPMCVLRSEILPPHAFILCPERRVHVFGVLAHEWYQDGVRRAIAESN